MAFPLPWRERVRVRGKRSSHHPHLNPPPSRWRRVFFELDASQLCCGVIYYHSTCCMETEKRKDKVSGKTQPHANPISRSISIFQKWTISLWFNIISWPPKKNEDSPHSTTHPRFLSDLHPDAAGWSCLPCRFP